MNWSEDIIGAVWQHGRVLPEADEAVWRQDACGAWMRRDQFGRDEAEFGWKIEPIAAGGPATPENLRPFHARNHYDLANGRTHCRVSADRASAPAVEYVRPPRNREI